MNFIDSSLDSNIKFYQVGHSLGYALGTLIHFTHKNSNYVNGFNGAGINIRGHQKFLEEMATSVDSSFDFSKRETLTNYVGSGLRLVANDIRNNQYGKLVVLKKSNDYIFRFKPEEIASAGLLGNWMLTSSLGALGLQMAGHKIDSLVEAGYDIETNTLYTINPTIPEKEPLPHSDSFSLTEHGLTDEMAKKMFKETKSEFKYLTTQPTEKLPDGRFKYDPVYTDYGWGLYADANTLNLDAYADRDKVDNATNTFKSNTVTDDFRLSNGNKSEKPISDISLPVKIIDIADSLTLNNASNLGKSVLPTDPLILDLNGDGIHLSSYNDNKILFDIDNDGGSLEQTGWINADDGFLVNDLNKNGKIDNISEIFSEFYAGKVGKNGETGEKRFKTGFDALRTLDSNNDGVFDKKDNAWNTVRVWKDKNQNGQTDKGELLTLASLKITKINLGYNYVGGEFYDGNEILARGDFMINGKTNQALSVNFLADPRGNTFTHLEGGVKVETQGDGRIGENSVFTSTEKGNTTLDAKKLGVKNIAAGVGNDVLKGDDGNNWLAGNLGSDTFYGGSGDDVLIIDGDDKAENIHGGEGEDIIQVVGNKAVNIDLFKAEVEAIQGGRGDDVIVSSGNKTVYVRGGDGDDTILGGFANDALSGENGNDLIMGNLGDDLIRGHRGNDYLIGNQGNDLIWGGSDDDVLFGGKGNDMLSGDSGDDYLDGEDGDDIVTYSGNFADYKIKKVQDGVLITDTVQGRDGTDFVRNVEKANFKDIKGYLLPQENDLGLDNPLPVMDIIDRDKNGRLLDGKTPYVISRKQLLANDIDLQNDKLDVTQLMNIKNRENYKNTSYKTAPYLV
ncbi:hypothetical protein KB562_04335 [Pasteurella atlantica]|nr:hypothetical protein [Pasteurella atlantica]QVE21818.1 hypothetical protein KGI96_00400 [Pasteurella atlantica]